MAGRLYLGGGPTRLQKPIWAPAPGLGRLRKIALLGSHYSLEFAPWDDPTWELWSHASTRMYCRRRPDRYYDLHRKECWTRGNKGDRYLKWLQQNQTPIFMPERYPEVPASIRYPLERVLAEFPMGYLTNHAAFMIAQALLEGCTHLGIFGINYGTDTEYATQRGSCEFWLGVATGRGVQIVLPRHQKKGCTLLAYPWGLYGYESHDEQGNLCGDYKPKVTSLEVATATGTESRPLFLIDPNNPSGAAPKLAQPPKELADEVVPYDIARQRFDLMIAGKDVPRELMPELEEVG